MVLRLGFDTRTQQFVIMINQKSTKRLSTVFTPTTTGIVNFINVIKEYDGIAITFDQSLSVQQRETIKADIAASVQLP